jgi:hypothetical protein
MTQNQQILSALKHGETLTPMDALDRFGCFRLAARVLDLKHQGHDIQTRYITQGNKTFVEYSLPGTVKKLSF